MDCLGNITPLIGRRFVADSNNVCRFVKLEDGAVSAIWQTRPTESDRQDCEGWVASILNVNVTGCADRANEAKALAEFKARLKKER